MCTKMKRIWNGKRKWVKRVLIAGAGIGVFGILLILGLNLYIYVSTEDSIFIGEDSAKISDVDCIMVLGAGVKPDGTPSLVLRDRLDRAIELYQSGVSNRLLMTGDHGREDYDEVNTMKQYAIDAGVPADHIFMDHAGFSTYESMYRARDIFEVERLAIVTQPYHEYRAVFAAQKLGLAAYGMPSKATKYRNSWMLEVRELLARTKEFFNLLIKPEPTYLGEQIPISGSGAATDDKEEVLKY